MILLKQLFALPLCLLLCTSFINSNTNNKTIVEKSYVKFSVSGKEINGTFNISGDQNNSSQNVTTMVYSDDASGEYKLADLAYMDGGQEMSVHLIIPAKKSLVEIKDINSKLRFSISIGDINLIAQSVSVNTENFVIDKVMQMTASYVKGSFEGVFIHEHIKDGVSYEDPYLVSGNFQIMSPRYKPRK